MTDAEKKDLTEFIKKVLELDDAGRASTKIVVEALLAREAVEGEINERREEKGSPAQCADVPSSQL